MASSIPSGPLVLTMTGRDLVQQRLDRALESLRSLERRMDAGERGTDELAEHARLLGQVRELRAVLAEATDSADFEEDPSIVEVGDEVDVETDDGVDTYALVHAVEVNAAEGRISIASPLGQAVLGARPGERVMVGAPAGAYPATVLARRRLA